MLEKESLKKKCSQRNGIYVEIKLINLFLEWPWYIADEISSNCWDGSCLGQLDCIRIDIKIAQICINILKNWMK